MAEMKLKEKEQQEDAFQASALPRGMQLFMRAKAAMAKKSAWCKTIPYRLLMYFLFSAESSHKTWFCSYGLVLQSSLKKFFKACY